ncbi:DUF6461 domain-containing protein [Plantactinospora solaniradicis]|uniref:DUF6461 domain-containing protein n=1 Tax=Plantactinospora solaniradicis TaxID=1723736 RepID=A0ABW1KEJ8_9ACTN
MAGVPQGGDWDWVRPHLSLGFCLALVHGRTEAELVTAFGVYEPWAEVLDFDTAADQFDPYEMIRMGRVGDWAFAWQEPAGGTADQDVLRELSVGGRALSVLQTGSALAWFGLMVDGVEELAFEPMFPTHRRGSRPDEYVPLMTEVGLLPPAHPDNPGRPSPTLAALSLATAVTGVTLSVATITGPLLTGEIGNYDLGEDDGPHGPW